MKSAVFLLAAVLAAVTASGQSESRFAYSTALGVGIALNEPASTPFVFRLHRPDITKIRCADSGKLIPVGCS